MSEKTLKTRKCKYCGEVFTKKFPLQFICSRGCEISYNKERQLKKSDGGKRKKIIAPVSEKRLKQLAEYRVAKKEFMQDPKNIYCPVMKHFGEDNVRTTDIHHINGRENDRLNDTEFWIAVSRKGHNWIHNNPLKARRMGWLI